MTISWRDVEVWRLTVTADGEGVKLAEPERLAALAEYRSTGAIADAVLAVPANFPDDIDGWTEAVVRSGPSVDEIDWTGFDGHT